MTTRRNDLKNIKLNKKSTNVSLWLDKYIFSQENDESEDSAKQKLVGQVSKIEVSTIYEDFFRDVWLSSLKNIEKHSINIQGRMIVGLGSSSVLETSITLHRTYGVPYIPGTALKGLAASFAHRFMGEDWTKQTDSKKIGKAHEIMFGSQDSAGYIIFHDALYIPNSWDKYPKYPLAPDILTVHHQNYYEGKDKNVPPADWDSPVPIPLISAQGKYLLAVSANSGDIEFNKKLVNLANEILEIALIDEGIGAKTSSGYGRALVEEFDIEKFDNPLNVQNIDENIIGSVENTQPPPRRDQDDIDERRLQGILEQLEVVANYKKDRKKLNDLKKRINKIKNTDLQQKGKEKYLIKLETLGRNFEEESKKLNWFIEKK